MSTQHDRNLRGFADALVGLETTINYVLEMAEMQGIHIQLEVEVMNQPHQSSRIHLRMVTPDMEVKGDLPTDPRKIAIGPTPGQETG